MQSAGQQLPQKTLIRNKGYQVYVCLREMINKTYFLRREPNWLVPNGPRGGGTILMAQAEVGRDERAALQSREATGVSLKMHLRELWSIHISQGIPQQSSRRESPRWFSPGPHTQEHQVSQGHQDSTGRGRNC